MMNWIKIDHSKLEEFPQGARVDLFISKEGYIERLTDKIVSKHKGKFIYSDLDGYDWGYIEEVTHYMIIEAPKKRKYESIDELFIKKIDGYEIFENNSKTDFRFTMAVYTKYIPLGKPTVLFSNTREGLLVELLEWANDEL